jgi:hypothetical protein
MMAPDDAESRTTRKHGRRSWSLLALGAAVLVVAAIIFSSAGPDRSRTAAYKDTTPTSVNPRGEGTEQTRQNVDMPTAPKR